jgi:hypothetical protein
MNRSTSNRQPTIHSPGTRRLAAHVRTIMRRDPSFDDTVNAIRRGDNQVLHELTRRAQSGDAHAAVLAIWAILPRLAAVIISRLPTYEWHEAMDDYITVAYLTLIDVDTTAPTDHLNDKIIARTRRRVERSMEGERLALCQPNTVAALAPSGNDVEERAVARVELATLACAVDEGLLDPDSWRTLLQLGFASKPGTASVRERKVASRARRQLQQWPGRAA